MTDRTPLHLRVARRIFEEGTAPPGGHRRGSSWYKMSPSRRILMATLGIEQGNAEAPAAPEVKSTERATRPSASKRGVVPSPRLSDQGRLETVLSSLDLIYGVLDSIHSSDQKAPVLGSIYVSTARLSVRMLREGLKQHRIGQGEALRLIDKVSHNLSELELSLRHQGGLSLDDDLHDTIDDLIQAVEECADRISGLRIQILQLFEFAPESASNIPTPSH